MASLVTIKKVTDKKDYKPFFEFPWKLYKNDPNWVPPLLMMRHDILSKKKNPSWEYLEGDYYTAWRGDEVVGTIAAFVNHRHNEFHNENICWFGFFESVDDQEVANALLNTAVEWGRSHGYGAVRGPQSFTVMDECGVLVEGFERPILLMPYNPPYYQTLLENAGFHKAMDTYSFYSDWESVYKKDEKGRNMLERMQPLVERLQKRSNISVRPLRRKNLKQEFLLFKEIYNVAWEKNWGFTPYTSKELDALVNSLGMFFDPDLACFGYVGDDPAGFVLAVPDLNQVLLKAYARPGVPEPISLVKALWHWKIRPVMDWIRVPLMGVKQEYRGMGVDMAMFYHTLQVLKDSRYKHLDSGWVLESNQSMMQLAKGLDMQAYRTYRFYERALGESE